MVLDILDFSWVKILLFTSRLAISTDQPTGPTCKVSSPETKNPNFADLKFSTVLNLPLLDQTQKSKEFWTKKP